MSRTSRYASYMDIAWTGNCSRRGLDAPCRKIPHMRPPEAPRHRGNSSGGIQGHADTSPPPQCPYEARSAVLSGFCRRRVISHIRPWSGRSGDSNPISTKHTSKADTQYIVVIRCNSIPRPNQLFLNAMFRAVLLYYFASLAVQSCKNRKAVFQRWTLYVILHIYDYVYGGIFNRI